MDILHTIVATATPNGRGALAIIRISGKNAFEITEKCLKNKEKFIKAEANEIHLYLFKEKNDEVIDEVTAVKYIEPKSFTGENMVEIFCHGGLIIPKEIIKNLIEAGAKIAERGEFSKRAFLNGKMDLMKAEAIKGLIESSNDIENKAARNAYQGKYLEKIKKWIEQIKEIIYKIDAEIEFEEDIEKSDEKIKIELLKKGIEEEIKKRKEIKNMDYGMKIIIAGPTNAGKSTLFNYLLGTERSIVNEEAGTTRDIISERINIEGKELTLYDTAGIRETKNKIEIEGIKRSYETIKNSAAVIWVTSSDEEITEEEKKNIKTFGKKIICLINKNDIKENKEKEKFLNEEKIKFIKTSLKNGNKKEEIINEIKNIIKEIEVNIEIPDVLINERQEEIAKEILENIKMAEKYYEQKEISSMFLNKWLNAVESLFGKKDNEEIINKIFNSFCIGK